MKHYQKADFDVARIRRFLEPGPVVLVSSAWQGETNIMTMGWHMMMGFSPALFGCYISEASHSFELVRRSGECVINLPTLDLIDKVVRIGNSTGAEIDKFSAFELTPSAAEKVGAPLIEECYANFECRLADGSQAGKNCFFIWEVVKAHVAVSPRLPETIHYRGDGEFMVSGRTISRRGMFRPEML
jgi:flavin reductase (DIM6/NTAB) family NADH-FMN oxidoreductase RutF